MKNVFRKTGILFIIFILIINSCKKEEVPVLTTASITNILGTSSIAGGTITSEGSGTVLSRGVCWSTLSTPTIADSKTQDGAGAGSFTSSITGLNGATVYYVRAYATNSVGTGYGMSISFTTLGQTPVSTNSPATNVTTTTATIHGTVTPNYLPTVVTFEYGTSTKYGSVLIIPQSPITGDTVTKVSADITALTPGTTYHYRVKSVNSLGTTYSDDVTFTTLGQVPIVTTLPATKADTSSTILNGSVNANYLSTDVTFEYGTTVNYGGTVPAIPTPIIGNTTINITSDLTGLTPGTTYHYRVKAVNSLGTSFGSDSTFTTLGQVPRVFTVFTFSPSTHISNTIGAVVGFVDANYLSTDVTFEYGTTTDYGSTFTSNQSPVTGDTLINVSANITGLTPGTLYHFRVKGVNSLGTSYGKDMEFLTGVNGIKGTVSDVDGNTYNTIGIGYEMWTVENLKTTKYNDGTVIPNVTLDTIWSHLSSGAYCDYDNNPDDDVIYGKLYNWYVVYYNVLPNVYNSWDGKNVCPVGWHVALSSDWMNLIGYVGGIPHPVDNPGGKLKETGTTHWMSPNTGATNETGFTGLPGGIRNDDGQFLFMGTYGCWWSGTYYDNTTADYKVMVNNNSSVSQNTVTKSQGASIRCVKDQGFPNIPF